MKSKLNKIRGLILLLLLMVLSANSKYLVSVASESEKSINTENIVATADAVLEKYINYENENAKGLLVQYGVNAGIEYKNNENYVPVTATGLLFNAPKIEEEYPTSVNIIAKSTLLTNGSNKGKDYKFVYKQETGEIAIVTSNNKDEEGKIYEGYKQNAKDSFSIILNYGENAYNSENKERNIEVSGKVVEALNTTEKTRIQNDFENKQTVKENVSKLVSTKVENTKVYNGYIKSNAVNGTDYETTYKENVQINISKENLGTQKIDLTQKFVNKENVETESENLVFKSSKLEKQNIIDILGEEGSLKILDDQENVLADINKDTQNNEDGTIKIDYPEGTNKITLELSNATKTGNIIIQNEKAITAKEKDFELVKIKETYNQGEVTDIEIQDSKTEVIIEPSQTTWTNEKQNEVEFKISLHNNSNKYNLFKNPVIAIQLPEETEKVLFNEKTTLTNANGLKIKNTEYNQEKRIIKVELEGEQTKYLSPALEDGTIIKIPAIIILSNNIESKEFNLKSAYQNENKYTGKTETEVINNKIILENFNQSLTLNDTMQTMTRRLTSAGPTRGLEGTQENATQTAEGISISVNPVIGDVTRDTVYEGEFIKYEITATNTTEEDIDNVKIVATLPDGVTYGELVREDNEPYVESYYDFEKQLQQIELGTIKAGKIATTYFEVKVNDLAEGETQKQITTNIKAFVGEDLSNEKEITHQVEKAEYKIFMSSNVYKSKEFQYTVRIKGNVQEKTDVKVKLPECIEPWAVVCNLRLYTTSKGFRVLENENAIVFEIEPDEDVKILQYGEIDDGIKEYEYQIFTRVISSKIEKTQNMSSTEISAIATIGNTKSNENRILLEYQTISLSMTSDNEGEKVKFGDSITYNIEIVNNGKNNYSNDGLNYIQLNIKDYLPDELIPKYIKYNDYEYDSNNNEFIEKDYIYELSEKATDMNGNVLPNIDFYVKIPYQEKITIEIKTLAGMVTNEKKIVNNAMVSGVLLTAIDTQQTEEISHIIVPDNYEGRDSNETNNEDSIENSEETENSEEPENTNIPDVPEETEEPEIKKYNIAGYVWNDKNEDGEKQNNEKLLSEIQTFLLNGDGEVVKETKTDNNGKYSFTDIENGEYNVVFKYNTNQYRITKCKASGVSESINSNAIKQDVVINGEKITAGVTEQITLNKNIEDINLGLIENKKFDFKVDNYISKITVKTKNETTETPYSKASLAKAEIKAKEIEGAVVTVEYKIIVTNNGELPGKVGKVIDFLPEGLNLASESISSWAKNTDGSVINTSLANKTLEAGESVELTLLATITMTENSIGTLTNNVKIDDLNNELGIQEINSQNNESKTEIILSINTGLLIYVSVALFIVIAVMIILNIKFNIFKNIKFRFLSFFVILVTIMICIGNSSIKAAGEKTYYEDDIDVTLTSDKRIRYRNTDQGTDSNGYHSFILYKMVDDGSYLTSSRYIKLKSTDVFRITEEVDEDGNVVGGGIKVYASMPDCINGIVRDFYDYNGLGFSLDEWKRILIDNNSSDIWEMKQSCAILYKENDWRASIKDGEINAMCADPNIPATYKTPLNNNSLGIVAFYERGYEVNYYPTEKHVYRHTMQETEDGILEAGNSILEHDFMSFSLSYTNANYIREMQNYKDLKITDNGERYNSSRTVKLKEKNGLVIIGPFNIKSSSNTNVYNRMTMWLRDGSSVNLSPCESNGDFLTTSLKGNTGNFYFRADKDFLISHGGISYIEIKSSDEPVDYQIELSGNVVKYYYRDGEQYNDNGYHEYQRFVKAEQDSSGNYIPKQEYIEETFKTKVSPNTSIKYNIFQGALTIHKQDEIGKDEDGNDLSMEGIYFAVNRKGYGWVEKNADGTYGYNPTWNESKAVKLRTNSDGTTDTIVGLEPLAHYIAEEGNSNGNGVYMIYEIIDALSGGNSAYNLPERFRDFYKATYPNGLYGCPYSLKAIENGNVSVSQGHYTDNKVNLKDSDPDNDGNHIWIESGEFWYSNSTNVRDYVSLQLDKCDQFLGKLGTQANKNNMKGIKFKVFQFGKGWIDKVNRSDPHSDIKYVKFEKAYELVTDSNGQTEILRRLPNGEKYLVVETYIPDGTNGTDDLSIYYTLKTASKNNPAQSGTAIWDVFNNYIAKTSYSEAGTNAWDNDNYKIKLICKNYGNVSDNTLQSAGQTINAKDSGTGKYVWKARNLRDFFTVQIYKQNKRTDNGKTVNDPLNDVKFAILEESSSSTESNRQGNWITTNKDGKYSTTKIASYNYPTQSASSDLLLRTEGKTNSGVFLTGEQPKTYKANGYTRVILKIPLKINQSYSIFEIDANTYNYLYTEGKFTFKGNEVQGKCIRSFKVKDAATITETYNPENDKPREATQLAIKDFSARYDANGKKIFNVYVVKYTNKQWYGSVRFRKVDQLTQTPLEGVKIKIKSFVNGSGWLKIEKDANGNYVVTDTNVKYDQATELVTDAEGYTPTVWKIPIYCTTNVKWPYAAFETFIPMKYRNNFALNSDFLEMSPTNTDADLEKFDSIATYDASPDGINQINNSTGLSLKWVDCAKRLVDFTVEENIDKNDITKPVITDFKCENEQAFVDISGYVWQDQVKVEKGVPQERDNLKNVGIDQYDDKYLNNITVRLMKRIKDSNGQMHTIKMAETKSGSVGNGKYKFVKVKIKDLENYYIEFDYCGITYETVVPGYTAEDTSIKLNNNNTRTKVQRPNSQTSKATETSARDTLNNAFGELTGEGQKISYKGKDIKLQYIKQASGEVCLDNTYKPYLKTQNVETISVDTTRPTYNYIITSQIKDFKDGNTTKNIIKYYYDLMAYNQTTSVFDGYEKNGKTLLTEIPNLNLGLYLRDQPALSLQKDVYKADMEINGKQFTYRYDGKIKTPDEFNELEAATGIVGVKFDGKYTLPMYEADLNYTTDDHSKELKTTITYKIKLQNSSSVLDSYIHELTDICSEELNIARDSKNRPLIYLMNTSDPSNEDFKEENLIAIDESNSTNILNKRRDIDPSSNACYGYVSYIRFQNAIKLDNRKNSEGNSIKYLYIVLTIDKNKIKNIYKTNNSTNDLFNVVEIRSYSSRKNNKKYAHVDYNSIPNNVNPMQLINRQNNGEDDDDVAPGLKIIKPTQRQVTGLVFEDMPVQKNKLYNKEEKEYDNAPFNKKVDPGEERVGDGVYNTTAGNNMDINGDGIPDADKPISGVKVKLVDSEGNPAKFWNAVTHKWIEEEYVESKADGTFDMTGFIPGDYHVEFVWGKEAGGKEVSRYKCTILSNPLIKNSNTARYEQEIEYYYTWYSDVVSLSGKSTRYSDAKDDYIRRLAIDKLKLNVADEAYNGLTTPDGTPLLNKVNKLISDVDGKTDDSNLKYMHSSTAEISIEVEKDSEIGSDGELYSTYDQTQQLKEDDCTGLDFKIKDIDFGIIERPKRAMSVQKRIKSIKVTTPEGRPIIIATIGIDGKVNAIAGEKFISGGYNLGYLYAQIDKNIEQAMKVEAEYDIIVSALSEIDYDDVAYYLYGIVPADGKELTLKATNLYDYSGGATITADSEVENTWKAAETGDKYLNIPSSSDNSNATATEDLLIDIFAKVGKNNKEADVIAALEEMNIFSNYQALDDSLSSSGARKALAKIYTEFIDEWDHSAKYKDRAEISVELIRALKLENREIVQCDSENILVKEPYKSGDIRIGTIKTSKIIANGDDIKIENDVEIASVAVDKDQKTGATPDPTYAPLYDRAEYVTVTPAQGEDKDYIGKAIVGIGILTVLASGIILIKRKIK